MISGNSRATKMADCRGFEDELASDDELPRSYNESPEIPAFENDGRFEPMDFPWILNNTFDVEIKDTNSTSSCSIPDELLESKVDKEVNMEETILLKKGVLSNQDIFCLKSVSTIATDTTILWFINFLINKDMLSDYKFLQSCLPVGHNRNDYLTKFVKTNAMEIKSYNYNIVLKL